MTDDDIADAIRELGDAPVVDPFDVAAVATACADHLLEHGWLQRELWVGSWDGEPYAGGATCALGAIGIVCGVRNVRYLEAYDHAVDATGVRAACTTADIELMPAAEALADLLGEEVVRFNDADGRDAGDIVQAFRDLAVKETSDEMRSRP